jgi:two-component sensor histidine kinase
MPQVSNSPPLSADPNARPAPRPGTPAAVWNTQQLRLATDAAGVALWSWDVDTDEITLDERAHRMWGVPLGDGVVTFESLSSRIHPTDLDRVRAAFTAIRGSFGAYETDFRVLVDDTVRWISARGRGDDKGLVGRIMFGVFLDVSERKLAEDAREMIANEMSHRIKNLFATVAALTRIAARSTTTPAAMADDIGRRLVALGNAKDLVRPTHEHRHQPIDLGQLLAALLAAYAEGDPSGDHIRVSMPGISVGEASITVLALVIHELATNSLKYGALSADTGKLTVTASARDGNVTIVWTERGGAPAEAGSGDEGFGGKLMRRSIVDQLGGSIDFAWLREGLTVTIMVREDRLGV